MALPDCWIQYLLIDDLSVKHEKDAFVTRKRLPLTNLESTHLLAPFEPVLLADPMIGFSITTNETL